MNNYLVFIISLAFAGNTVIETSTYCKNQVRFLNSVVRSFVTMKTSHTEEQATVSTDSAQAHQSTYNRNVHLFAKIHCVIFSVCTNYATTNKHYRAFCFSKCSNSSSDVSFCRFIFHNRRKLAFYIINQGSLHIARNVNKDRTRTTSLCHLESKTQSLC